jgi:hypothetical protein
VYFQIIDKMTTCLKTRFLENKDLLAYAKAEALLINTNVSLHSISDRCKEVVETFTDIDQEGIKTELSMLYKCQKNNDIPAFANLSEALQFFSQNQKGYRSLFPEISTLIRLLVVVPPTSATAERSFSCLKRVKTWLRSTMSQTRLNSVALLHSHRDMQPDLDVVLKEFIGLNDTRRFIFGQQ